MRAAEVRLTVLVVAAAVSVTVARASPSAIGGPPTSAAGFAAPTPSSRTQGLHFQDVAPSDQQAVLAAVASARPQARQLIDQVAGLVTVQVGSAGPKASGMTDSSARGYLVMLDLGEVGRALGTPGIQRLVLHELGHVVRHALVPDAVLAATDAGIPRGYGCDDGVTGACTNAEERFAETFAKWAMNDIGVYLDIGYRVPPPSVGLEAWAQPLTQLGR